MSTESEKKGIEASFKSMDTEEFLDIYFNRPIGYAWALFFKKLKVHPNVVTIFSIILGIGAGVMFYYPDMKHTLLGILLLMWANHSFLLTCIITIEIQESFPPEVSLPRQTVEDFTLLFEIIQFASAFPF
jgi:hypothetical protein